MISLCFKLPWKWRQGEISSPPQSICLSDGVSWGQGSAVARAENDVKGGRVCPLPSWSRVCSHLVLSFFGQNPPFESLHGASRSRQSHSPWQLLLGLVLLPRYQGPADAKPHSGLLFCKPLTGFEGMKGFGYLQVPSQCRGSAGVEMKAGSRASSERRGLAGRCG